MKCEVHPDQDALGTCMSCGRGVCAICKVIYQGTIHCKQCVEAGRFGGFRQALASPMYYPYGYGMPYQYQYPQYQYPQLRQKATPSPRGHPDGRLFRVGSVGSILAGILTITVGIAILLEWGPSNFSGGLDDQLTIGSSALLSILQLVAAVGLLGLYRNYGPALPLVGATALSASGFIFLVMVSISTDRSVNSLVVVYGGILALGVANILIGAAILDARRFLDARELPVLAGLMFLLGGSLMCGLVGIFLIGWILITIGYILLSVILFTAPVPGPAKEAAEPEGPAGSPPGAGPKQASPARPGTSPPSAREAPPPR